MFRDRKRKRIVTKRGIRRGTRRERIFIPQPKERVFSFRRKDVVRKVQEDPWWFVLHRRGVKRPKVGVNPLEARAVPKWYVKGFLHERIVYKWLTDAHFRSERDFSFQSSMFGGRMELGGVVADFVFLQKMIILRVQGPTHKMPLRMKKDEEQRLMLASMGYRVVDIWTDEIENEMVFNEKMRRLVNLWHMGTAGPEYMAFDDTPNGGNAQQSEILTQLQGISDGLG